MPRFWCLLAIALLVACDVRPDKPGRDKQADAGTTASSGVDGTTAPAGGVVKLRSGATLTMPKGATAGTPPRALPKEVLKAHLFHVGARTRMLLINEMELGDKDCKALLKQEWKRMQDARKDKLEKRLEFRKVQKIERLEIGGRRVLYSEAQQRGFTKTDAGKRPMVGMASAILCEGKDYVVMVFASKDSGIPPGTQAMVTGVAGSYSASR